MNGALILWFLLTGLSLIYITYDLFKVTPEAAVMKWGWWLVTLYTGPIGLFFYLISCKEPMPGTHELFVAPHWKQSLGSMVHCLAGDVTGIIIAALFLAWLKPTLPIEILIEYLAGFAFGILIFQSLFMKDMWGGSYAQAVKKSLFPEFTSMNMIMAGMIPTMVIWTLIEPAAKSPLSIHFWGKMSLASIIAGITAYPMNSWLVKTGLKHGMMTVHKDEKQEHSLHMHQARTEAEHQHHTGSISPREMAAKLIWSLVSLGIGILISLITAVRLLRR